MPGYKARILSTGLSNRKKKHTEKAFIYGMDVSDTVKDIGVEIDQNSLTLTEQYIHRIFVTVAASVIVPFVKTIKVFF